MYKNISIAVLLVAFGLVAARSTGAPVATLTPPNIVKKVILANQTAPIPTTTIFTPASNGLFRLSVYITQVVPAEKQGNQSNWQYQFNWTDDAGAESLPAGYLMWLGSSQIPPNACGVPSYSASPGTVAVFEAIAGQPVSFSVNLVDPVGVGGGTYSLYFTVERLI
jgi:hypothetical protein